MNEKEQLIHDLLVLREYVQRFEAEYIRNMGWGQNIPKEIQEFINNMFEVFCDE